MTIILSIVSYVCVFLFGRIYGQIESSMLFSRRINALIEAMRKVENLATLRGEDLSKISTNEWVERTRKQMDITNDD